MKAWLVFFYFLQPVRPLTMDFASIEACEKAGHALTVMLSRHVAATRGIGLLEAEISLNKDWTCISKE